MECVDDEDDLNEFLDANTFCFGMDGLETAMEDLHDMPLKACVKFNPMVSIFGGGQVPIAAGDGFWDTLQYECTGSNATGRRSSLSLNDLDGTEGSLSESKLFNDSGSASASMSLGDINSPGSGSGSASLNLDDIASPGDGGGGGIREVFFEGGSIYTKGQQLLDFMSKVLKGDSDEDLLVDEDDAVQTNVADLQGSFVEGGESSSSLKGAIAAVVPNSGSNSAAANAGLTLQ